MAHITLLAHGLPGRGPGHQRRHITISIAIPMGGQGRLPPPSTQYPAPPLPKQVGVAITFVLIWCFVLNSAADESSVFTITEKALTRGQVATIRHYT